MMKKLYVLGFLFSEDKERVALIKKTKPEWQAGLLNGIGGKVEGEENSLDAMIREFQEETGYFHDQWRYFASMTNSQFIVDCFVGFGDVDQLKTTTEEEVTIVNVHELYTYKTIPNLSWLLPLSLDNGFEPVVIMYEEAEKYMEPQLKQN